MLQIQYVIVFHLLDFIFFLLSLVSTNPSIEAKSLPCAFFVDVEVSNSFYRMSMIVWADPSSSKTSFS